MKTQSNKLNFIGQNIYVGFDVHLKSWKVTILTDELTHKTFSQPPKPEVLYNYLHQNFPGGIYHSAYEAGFCGYWIHSKLVSFGIDSMVVNPADIPTTNKEVVQKEDKRDSRKIAKALRNGDLLPIYVPSLKTLEDRGLIRTCAMLVKDLTRYKNRIKSFLYFHGIEIPGTFSNSQTHCSKRFMDWLESIVLSEESSNLSLSILLSESYNLRKALLEANRNIRVLSRTKGYKENVSFLQSIPGIGMLTAMLILTGLESIDRFANIDKLCSYIGLVPSTNSSGETEKVGKITPRKSNVLRTAIIESAWVAARTDPALLKSYHSYCKRMGPNKAIIRIARKLLGRIHYVLKNKKPYVYSLADRRLFL
jgi:transposase